MTLNYASQTTHVRFRMTVAACSVSAAPADRAKHLLDFGFLLIDSGTRAEQRALHRPARSRRRERRTGGVGAGCIGARAEAAARTDLSRSRHVRKSHTAHTAPGQRRRA